MKEIEQIKLEHDCGCEVCSTVSQVCPATASSYAQEILTLRSTIASLQREAVESSANFLSEQGLRIAIAGLNKRLEEIIYSQKDRIVGLQREVKQWKERHTTVVDGYNQVVESYDQARAAVERLEKQLRVCEENLRDFYLPTGGCNG